jgi:hypothetical protein
LRYLSPFFLMSAKKLRALLVGCLVILVGVELIWVVGANWALSSGFLEERLNRRPGKLTVAWERAHTVIPGWISVHGVAARGQTKKQQWYAEADRARVHLSLVALARRTFRTYSLKAYELDVRVRRRQLDVEAPPLAEFWPGIPGLSVDAPLPPPRKRQGKRPWIIDLDGIRVDGVKQAWILPYRFVARGTVRANLRAEVRGPVAIDGIVGALHGVEIFARGSRVADGLRLDIEAALESYLPAEVKGLAVWRSLSGSVSLAGRSTTSGLLNQIFARFGPIEVGDAGGAIAGTLLVGHGRLLEGSHLELTPEGGWLELLDWRAEGKIDAGFVVRGVEEADRSILTLSLAGVDVVDKRIELPVLEGASVELTAAAGEIDLTRGTPGLPAAVTAINLDLSGATVADITRFRIPPVEDLSVDSGRVVVEGHVVVDRTAAEARLEAVGEGIGATYGDVAINGDISVELEAATSDLASRRFTLADSSLRIDDVTIGEGEKAQKGWYAHLDIREGTLSLLEPREIGGAFDLRMRDSRPIIAILQNRRPVLRKLKGILDFSDLTGVASVSVAADGLVVEEVDIAGEGLHVMTRLRIAGSKASGIFYSRFHGVPLGVDLRGEKADLIFRRPKRWYEVQKAGPGGIGTGHLPRSE